MRDLRGKAHRAVRRRRKARGQGARGQARVHGWSHLDPGSRGAQMLREKLWVPWNGLIVIGKRMDLLGRNTQKPRMCDPKLDSEYWGREDVEKMVLKAKSGQSQERMDVKLLHSVANALRASAGLGKNSPKEMGGKQEIRGKIGAESESARTTAGSRKGSGFKERLKFTGVGTGGEDLRSRPHTLGQNEEELRSSGEELRSSGEQLRSSGEQLRSSGEKLRSSGEKLRSRGEKLRSSREKLRSSGEKLTSSGEKLSLSEENLRSSGEKEGSRGEKPESSGEDLRSTGDKLQSSAEKLEGSGMESITEETTERMVEVTGDEKWIKVPGAEMENRFEKAEGSDEELEGTEEAMGVEDVLGGVNDVADESVSMEEKEVIDEGNGE
ncbi:protein Ycf2-like [Zalophus californianus]|uniref:Protein Ycf2-like n=1 Tax=Zalophus californianus TaxID=9704 RepID=A0A6J2BPG5_ZALCA|nr:protein Ycf2-like [Zalophus californianus]XP_027433818.1 protein Ycf2-like [Zalophus californianus]XP_027433819.1 protein Ycf2-like [Zalophus californianus]XP_027433821.1 protein Ycf2-like [Zalophus californianus]XP_027433822.1 protein Ycf2-like [Zalophus californianus]XP_027433823.1 protein Ycf2-like [Zalophus californianus]XP_027433824.1 protein Ycf2-like [Zalophus californianus]XP_027433825.1 protein Ycf2-like [Zalophus californianus]XP_027433826.1 protein Ycf2-like [Zalophus californ